MAPRFITTISAVLQWAVKPRAQSLAAIFLAEELQTGE